MHVDLTLKMLFRFRFTLRNKTIHFGSEILVFCKAKLTVLLKVTREMCIERDNENCFFVYVYQEIIDWSICLPLCYIFGPAET